VLSLLTLCVLSGGPALAADDSPARATQDARARELWENGAILYSEGRYEDAILAWQEAYRLSERHLILTNIANAQERLGLWRDALDTLNRYRAFAPAQERESLDRRIANLERRLAEQQSVAPAPAPVAPPPAAPVPAQPSLGLPVALLAGGVAGIGVGATFGVLTLGVRDDVTALCVSQGDDLLCPTSTSEGLAQDRRFSLVADMSAGTGVLLVAAGVATLVRARGAGRAVQAGLAPAPGGGLVVVTGGF